MARNTVICKVVAKECEQLRRGGCEPSVKSLSACVKRLGSADEIQYAFNAWHDQHIGSAEIAYKSTG